MQAHADKPMVTAYIGLGSNLAEPVLQIRRALAALEQLPESVLRHCSSLYLSPPMGPADQPDYVNAVAALETTLPPLDLLTRLQRIEQAQGRTRSVHWGPRTLDLDLLLYGDRIIEDERLRVPHPGLPERAFVLYPLQEIAPDLELPGLGPLAALLANCPMDGLKRHA